MAKACVDFLCYALVGVSNRLNDVVNRSLHHWVDSLDNGGDVDGVRNAEARATAVLGPILAAGLPLVASPELGLMTLGKAVLALVAGAAATFVGRRAG